MQGERRGVGAAVVRLDLGDGLGFAGDKARSNSFA